MDKRLHKAIIGKTISKVSLLKRHKYDDEAWLRITFTDGSGCVVVASYGTHTGDSEGEYPTFISIRKIRPGDQKLVEVDIPYADW